MGEALRVGLRAGLAAVALIVGTSLEATAQSGATVLSSDLSFHFVCSHGEPQSVQVDVEAKRFLVDAGFKVLDIAKARHDHGVPESLATDIVALDDARRIIRVISVPSQEGRYAMTLTSRPPTQHAVELEDALLKFVSGHLRCETRQLQRSENAVDAIEFYERMVKLIEGWFEQDERNRGHRRL